MNARHRPRPAAAPALLAAGLLMQAGVSSAAPVKEEGSVVSQEITIKGRGSAGPPISVPAPKPDRAVLQEVVESLDLYRADHRSRSTQARIPAAEKRLLRPFPLPPYLVFSPRTYPHPHDRWLFEVLRGGDVVRRMSGSERLRERLEWDGTDDSGRLAARVGESYQFRFTGVRGDAEFALSSEPVELKSLAFREGLGDFRLEVANAEIFLSDKAALKPIAAEYLEELSARLRRANPREKPYRLELRQRDPKSRLARERAETLRKYFSEALLVNPGRVLVEPRSLDERGDVTTALLPPSGGDTISTRER